MNKWQKIYCDTYHNGKMPRRKSEKHEYELLGKINKTVTIDFPDFNSPIASQCKPAHTDTYTLVETNGDFSKYTVTPEMIAGNLALWESRGYDITFN